MNQSMKSIDRLKIEIQSHAGMSELGNFGANFKAKPLNHQNLTVFMSTLWAFFKETSQGILSLSLRVIDYWSQIDIWQATAKGAYLLCADVDEFGLHDIRNSFSPTHHQLFLATINHFGIDPLDIESGKFTLAVGSRIGQASYQYYRNNSLAAGLGFHLASEFTSWPEFKYFLDGFMSHKKIYNILSAQDKAMIFFQVHTIVEPMHLENSEKIVCDFCEINPEAISEVRAGALIYMDYYRELFCDLNAKLYNAKPLPTISR